MNNKIKYLLHDSRQLQSAEDTLFFAIETGRNDGHKYIPELYEKGVREFIIEKEINLDKFPDANFKKVNKSILELQNIVRNHRSQFNIPVIGITGSNGKTIVKEWLFHLLSEKENIIRSPQSYNSQIGVPLSVWELSKEHTLGIFEAGVSKQGEMEALSEVINCDFGVFTSLGTAHAAGFKNDEEKVKEKSILFKNCKKVFYKSDIPYLDKYIKNGISFGNKKSDTLQIISINKINEGNLQTKINTLYKQEEIIIKIPFSDAASCDNALLCCLVCLELGYKKEFILNKVKTLPTIAMRLEVKKGINNTILINDTYNSDATSLQSSLSFLENQAGNKNGILILSDILEDARTKKELYKKIGDLIHGSSRLSKIIGIGKSIQVLKEILKKEINFQYYPSTEIFLSELKEEDFNKEIILVKGAREFRFERIVSRLQQQAHRTILEVSFQKLISNLNTFKKHIKPTTKIMVMVKASGYGAGSAEIAKLMEQQSVDYLAVAYTDEGVELRNAGVTLPIMVLNPEPNNFDALLRHELEPEIYSLELLQQFHEFTRWRQQTCQVHLNLDSGMKRLGFEEKDMNGLIHFLNQNEIKIQSVFSHLAGSDAAEHDDFTKLQMLRFTRMYERIATAIGKKPMRHILNSAGIIRFPNYQMDMVRLGIGLYGVDTSQELQGELQVISSLKATISQIKTLQAGESVGYNRGAKVFRPTQIATISIGYADGLPRSTGYGKYSFLIRGQRAKTIGVICMDMCMVDITHIPDVRIGDEVIIFGETPSIQELADVMETIPYEVLTAISDRVKRVYLMD